MSTNDNTQTNTRPELPRPSTLGQYLGHVKWFNNSEAYGFIRVISEGEHHNRDVFVHLSNIYPSVSGYKTLLTGEYVSLNLSTDERPQAVDVTGVLGGPLMCDQPRPQRQRKNRTGGRSQRDNNSGDSQNHGQSGSNNGGEWTQVGGGSSRS